MPAARSIGSATISFGLVSIPSKIYTSAKAESVSFNLLHTCGSRTKQQLVCPACDVVVERSDTVRGFEYSRDQYVHFTNEELRLIEAARPPLLEILEFAPDHSLRRRAIEKSYLLGPDIGGERSSYVLARTLYERRSVAVGRFANRGKDNLVALESEREIFDGEAHFGLVLHEAYYEKELRSFRDIGLVVPHDLKPGTLEMAGEFVGQLSCPLFDASKFRDTYHDKVMAAVNQKLAGQEVMPERPPPRAQIVDILEALKRSVLANETKPPSAEPAVSTVKGPRKASPRKGEPERRRETKE